MGERRQERGGKRVRSAARRPDVPPVLPGHLVLDSEHGTVQVHWVEVEGRLEPRGLVFNGSITSDWLRSIPIGQLIAAVNDDPRSDRIRSVMHMPGEVHLPKAGRPTSLLVTIPEGRGRRPDAFYSRVAALHASLLANGSRRPAEEIAAANDIPVTTVHRWMKEARTRGLVRGSA